VADRTRSGLKQLYIAVTQVMQYSLDREAGSCHNKGTWNDLGRSAGLATCNHVKKC
jgi:hypothetical protein